MIWEQEGQWLNSHCCAHSHRDSKESSTQIHLGAGGASLWVCDPVIPQTPGWYMNLLVLEGADPHWPIHPCDSLSARPGAVPWAKSGNYLSGKPFLHYLFINFLLSHQLSPFSGHLFWPKSSCGYIRYYKPPWVTQVKIQSGSFCEPFLNSLFCHFKGFVIFENF